MKELTEELKSIEKKTENNLFSFNPIYRTNVLVCNTYMQKQKSLINFTSKNDILFLGGKTMQKLLDWIRNKYMIDSIILEGAKARSGGIPKQMLIGYMIEYCNEHDLSLHLLNNPNLEQVFNYLKTKLKNYQRKNGKKNKHV